jgi:hypothetical protein
MGRSATHTRPRLTCRQLHRHVLARCAQIVGSWRGSGSRCAQWLPSWGSGVRRAVRSCRSPGTAEATPQRVSRQRDPKDVQGCAFMSTPERPSPSLPPLPPLRVVGRGWDCRGSPTGPPAIRRRSTRGLDSRRPRSSPGCSRSTSGGLARGMRTRRPRRSRIARRYLPPLRGEPLDHLQAVLGSLGLTLLRPGAMSTPLETAAPTPATVQEPNRAAIHPGRSRRRTIGGRSSAGTYVARVTQSGFCRSSE